MIESASKDCQGIADCRLLISDWPLADWGFVPQAGVQARAALTTTQVKVNLNFVVGSK